VEESLGLELSAKTCAGASVLAKAKLREDPAVNGAVLVLNSMLPLWVVIVHPDGGVTVVGLTER